MISRRNFLRLPLSMAVASIGMNTAESKLAATSQSLNLAESIPKIEAENLILQRYLIRSWGDSSTATKDAVYFSFPVSWKTAWH
jgi:hypothetical protein